MFLTHIAIVFVEGGFDDGPFYGRSFDGTLDAMIESESLPYADGRIVVFNRDAQRKSPIFAFRRIDGSVKWAVEMDVSAKPFYSNCNLRRIENLRLVKGRIKDEIVFDATWTYGGEQGRAFIWKLGHRFQRFYLSW